MFGFFESQEKKTRENASNWLELSDKVWHFRRDLLTDRESGELLSKTAELRQQLKAKSDAATLKLSVESLENVLRRTGGAIYPKTSLVENVEFFLVAAIVIIGIRTYFVQPFKIPTNSMWPTYYGMTAENFPPGGSAPDMFQRVLRFAAFGAKRREVVAPAAGKLSAEFDENTGQMAYQVKNDRTWLVFPTQVKEYSFYVGDTAATVRVPRDFNDFDKVVAETFFGGEKEFLRQFLQARRERTLRRQSNTPSTEDYTRAMRLPLGRTVNPGDLILRFEILTGDQLFVDRVSYHFMQPKVGQGFVFRTDHISGIGEEQYYIKRLVGVPGDVLEIQEPTLLRNGKPIEGAFSFDQNSKRIAPYRGYFNAVRGANPRSPTQYLLPDEKMTVPAGSFFALGDNSGSSLDGRYWGFVPNKDAIGRPLFIYYPFTKRWGPAR
ncbi:MAG: signal peptidase I [Opitutus sp.]